LSGAATLEFRVPEPTGDITRLIERAAAGDHSSADALLTQVYEQLRGLARRHMAQERAGLTLQPTALVHEAYLRLLGNGPVEFQNRAHFFAAAAEAMRRILIERARRRSRAKHGGGRARFDLSDSDKIAEAPSLELLAIDEALERFAAEQPQKAELVKLRYYAGLTLEQAAEVLGISRATADRHWSFARAWLFDAIGGSESKDSSQ
jgi:RNA polymerase sigma factor (TIGR02999 family)